MTQKPCAACRTKAMLYQTLLSYNMRLKAIIEHVIAGQEVPAELDAGNATNFPARLNRMRSGK